MRKIINFTPTGTQTTRSNSYAPLLPNEIIEEVHQANELGISVVHLHARDELTLENTYKKETYQKIIEGI
jgi:3-keto-5-aminohexanoate cleavage enzyme